MQSYLEGGALNDYRGTQNIRKKKSGFYRQGGWSFDSAQMHLRTESHLTHRVIGPARARELIYTARVLKGQEAAELGLVQ